MTVSVVLVDDHTVVRDGLRALLQSEDDLEIVGEADSGEDALEVVERTAPEVVVMDLRLPNMSGVEATRALKKSFPRVKVIILSMYDEEDIVFQALESGASGYVLKRAGVEELVKAIHTVIDEGAYLDPAIARRVVDRLHKKSVTEVRGRQKGEDILTPREKEILMLVARGMTNSQIAAKLYISVKTVQAHRANLMQKLEVHDRVELVKYAVKKGLISLNDET